ncbi:hypothetical protein [Kitasatospora sp. NPDC057936]|uniref:hypothetical protein n=1 Tax=Kitasatospora sp. NPDC057936 TaxID=3346283 RepID=UPI0036DD23CB
MRGPFRASAQLAEDSCNCIVYELNFRHKQFFAAAVVCVTGWGYGLNVRFFYGNCVFACASTTANYGSDYYMVACGWLDDGTVGECALSAEQVIDADLFLIHCHSVPGFPLAA